jgi:hypothetical protein
MDENNATEKPSGQNGLLTSTGSEIQPSPVDAIPFEEMRKLPYGEILFEMYCDAYNKCIDRMMVEGAEEWWKDMNREKSKRYMSLLNAMESGEIVISQNTEDAHAEGVDAL